MSMLIVGNDHISRPRQRAYTIGHKPDTQFSGSLDLEPHQTCFKDKPVPPTLGQPIPSLSKCYVAEAPQAFDKPGTELDGDAQVWKTYVKEANQVDIELVDGWNKSLDVILIFAALFSAVATAFAIEGYKNLRQDPNEISAQTLVQISLTLVAVANGTHFTDDQPTMLSFKPSIAAIFTNVLWFLSLSLSIGVSLVAMLAKEWCFVFISGRVGSPIAQARRRQQRWDGLVGWKMREVLIVLPSLIHLSLLLFAIGLCIFLWEVHFAVAIPVIFVSTVAACAYGVCTVLPFFDNYCPYGSVVSRIYKQFNEAGSQAIHDASKQDEVTARALHWMVTNCETPRSVEVALQSVAAADKSLPVDILEECDVWSLIKHRYGSKNPYDEQPESTSMSLYAKALKSLVLLKSRSEWVNYGAYPETRRLELLVLGLQSHINSLRVGIRSRPDFTSHSKQKIYSICTQVGDYCITAARRRLDLSEAVEERQPEDSKEKPDTMNDVVILMEQYLNNELDLEPDVYRLLSTSFALLLCCGTVHESPSAAAEYLMRLLRTSRGGLVSSTEVGIALGAFAICRGNYPGWSNSCSSELLAGAERAVDLIWNLVSTSVLSNLLVELQVLGVFHLLSDPRYRLSETDTDHLSRRIEHLSWIANINFRLPSLRISPSFDLSTRCIDDITGHLLEDIDLGETRNQLLTCLNLLGVIQPPQSCLVPSAEIYMFVVQCLCSAQADKTKQDVYSLLASFPFPKLSKRLVELISRTHIVSGLQELTTSHDSTMRLFGLAYLWILITLSLQPVQDDGEIDKGLEEALLWYSALDNNLENRGRVAENLVLEFSTLFEHCQSDSSLRGKPKGYGSYIFNSQQGEYSNYCYRVLECMLQQQSCPTSDPRWKLIDSNLEGLPENLRGLTTFVYTK